jgi:small conductance mechanosensitive channel
VQDVKLASTVIATGDNVTITIPNKHVVGEILHNSREVRIATGTAGIPYGADAARAVEVVRTAVLSRPEVSRENAPQVGVEGFGDSSINIGYRYWVPTLQFYQVMYAVNLAVLEELNKAGMHMPFPQREIRILGGTPKSS